MESEHKTWIAITFIVCASFALIIFFVAQSNTQITQAQAQIASDCVGAGKDWVPSAVQGVFQCVGVPAR